MIFVRIASIYEAVVGLKKLDRGGRAFSFASNLGAQIARHFIQSYPEDVHPDAARSLADRLVKSRNAGGPCAINVLSACCAKLGRDLQLQRKSCSVISRIIIPDQGSM